jgi:signal transduction histidine kinase
MAGLLFSERDRKRRLMNFAIFLLLLLPVLFIGTFSYLQSYRDLSSDTYARRQALAFLAATALEQKFDRLTDLGVSLATRVRFRHLISQGKWDDAIEILRGVPKDFPFIDRLIISDLKGTLMADIPAVPEVKGRNFAYRDWYTGVSKNWEPYVSEVYQRAAKPRYNVVAVATPIKSEDGSVVAILVLQVKIDTLLEWTKDIEVGPSGFVYVVDRNGKVAAHPKFELQGNIVDYSGVPAVRKALRGERGVEVLFNPIEKEERLSAYAPVPRYGWGVIAQQATPAAFAARDSSLRRILITYGMIFLFAAALAHFIIRAISERKLAEEEIRKLNERLKVRAAELEAANKELEAFSYSVSHDLRAPLRAMDGFSRILLEKHGGQMSPDAQRYQNLIRDNARQMGQLIDDLLTFSRLSRQPLKRQSVNPADLARQALQELRSEQDGRRVRVSIGDLPPCQADPALLKQVFVNFLSNALKFTRRREDAQIEVGSLNSSGEPVYYVQDNGVGFDMKYADKLFGVFQRLHRAEDYEGTGVGLAIVQRIVHRHGGRVWAEADKGATFYFTVGG